MKISVDGREVGGLSETQKKVIQNDIHKDDFDNDIVRRLNWALTHKYERCLERMRTEWMPKLKSRVDAVPTNDDDFATLVFSQPDYKCRKQRDESGR